MGNGVLLVFGAPSQLPSLAGPEHGRTIPLPDIDPRPDKSRLNKNHAASAGGLWVQPAHAFRVPAVRVKAETKAQRWMPRLLRRREEPVVLRTSDPPHACYSGLNRRVLS